MTESAMPRRPLAPFEDVARHLRTGDLIFCRGRMMSSRIIEFLTGGLWSHVATVIEPRDIYPDTTDTGYYLWESTSIPGQDVDPTVPRGKTGPMLVPLAARLAEYLNSPNYRLLSARYLQVDRTPEMRAALRAFVTDPAIRLAAYPEERSILCDYIRHRYLMTTREQGTFFCSELVAATWQAMGLLPHLPHIQSYAPRDFSETGYVPSLLRSELGQERHMGIVGINL